MSNCEKCSKMIPTAELDAHMDFHFAEDLDRETNPNKKKYKLQRNFSEFEKEHNEDSKNSFASTNSKTEASNSKPEGFGHPAKKQKISPMDKKSDLDDKKITVKPINSYFRKAQDKKK